MGKFSRPDRFPNVIAGPKDKKAKNPWNFDQPTYDERTSCFVNAGSYYGVGHRTPVGKMEASGYDKGPIPLQNKKFPSQYIHHGQDGRLDTEEL